MENNMTRRSALTGFAALASAIAPAVSVAEPSFKQLPSPDAEFIALVAKNKIEVEEMRRTDEVMMASYRETLAKYPPLPDVLKMTKRDAEHGLPQFQDRRYPGYYTTFQLSELERCRPSARQETPLAEYKPPKGTDKDFPVLYYPTKGIVVYSVPNPEAVARLTELKFAIRKWKAACERVERAAGTDEANKKSDEFWNANHEFYEALVSYEPKTIAGLTAKAELVWLMHIGDSPSGLDIGDDTDSRMISSIFDDIRRLAKSA